MAGAPAYRYDHRGAQPYRQPAPSVHVVPGTKQTANPVVSDFVITGLKILIVCLIAFLLVGFARVGLASAAYDAASQASELESQVSDARATGESLAVEESLLSSSSNIRTQAQERLNMKEGVSSETITLSVDPVSIDSAGNLSFAGSVSRLTSQG